MLRFLALSAIFFFSIPAAVFAQCAVGETEITITVVTDQYGSETTWALTGLGGAPVYASGGPYTDGPSITDSVTVCLPDSIQAEFTINDSYGDGMCCNYGNGSYTVESSSLLYGTGGNFGDSETIVFWVDPPAHEVELLRIDIPEFPMEGAVDVVGKVYNNGAQTITDLEIAYTIDGGTATTETVSGLSIEPFSAGFFELANDWMATPGNPLVEMEVVTVNGNVDFDPTNNAKSKSIVVSDAIPNIIDNYLNGGGASYTVVATDAEELSDPQDLDFHPEFSRNELWVINKDNETSGGSTVTFFDAGLPTQTSEWKRDGNAWHFMALPTAMAFGENGNWASSPGIKDANHTSSGSFTGPTLWSSNMDVYAEPSGGNGSHLDMLHGSPFSMGIAYERGNVYWVYDSWNSDIVRYDFQDDHGPGNDYHGDAIVTRYTQFSIDGGGDDVPSHMVLDRNKQWLYFVDFGNQRVMRLDITTGTNQGGIPLINEQLAVHEEVTGAVEQELISSALVEPAGIEVIDNYLLVSDHTTGDIAIYDLTSGNAVEAGRISTGRPGIRGIKIGPDGAIWYVNSVDEELVRIDAAPVGLADATAIAPVQLFPNPARDHIRLNLQQEPIDAQAILVDAMGKTVLSELILTSQSSIDLQHVVAGVYQLIVAGSNVHSVHTVVVE